MSRSNWFKFAKVVGLTSAAFLVVALIYGVGFYTGNSSGYYQGQAERAASQYPSDTQRIIDGCFELVPRADASKCITEAIAASHENQRAEYDLNAQRDMADWAWWVMVIGVLQFFATIATLGFVKMTLDATLKAVEDTSEATEAMREANGIAREAMRRQLRAYVSVGDVRICDHEITDRAMMGAIIKNDGSTPASVMSFFAVFAWMDGETEGQRTRHRVDLAVSIPPGQT